MRECHGAADVAGLVGRRYRNARPDGQWPDRMIDLQRDDQGWRNEPKSLKYDTWDLESEDQAIPKKPSKEHRPTRLQFGALPYRVDGAGVEVLLVTSRETKRWIIPKGWPIKGFKPAKTAAREAYEEAGVRGRIAGRAVGHYMYEKWFDDKAVIVSCEVRVFPLLVKRQLEKWPECKQRRIQWFRASAAADIVDDDDLRRMILTLQSKKHKGARGRKQDARKVENKVPRNAKRGCSGGVPFTSRHLRSVRSHPE